MINNSFTKNSIDDIKIIYGVNFEENNGNIYIFENLHNLKIGLIKRLFFVNANKNDLRGHHAHLECTQLIFIMNGKIKLHLFDGKKNQIIMMDNKKNGVLVPNGIWAIQEYLENNTTISVLCDTVYNENEYIRDKSEFMKLKNG